MSKVTKFFGSIGKGTRSAVDATKAVVSAGVNGAKDQFAATSGVEVSVPKVNPVDVLAGTARATGKVVGFTTGAVVKGAVIVGTEAVASSKALVDGYKGQPEEIVDIMDSLDEPDYDADIEKAIQRDRMEASGYPTDIDGVIQS